VKTVKVGIIGFGTMGQRHLKDCLLIKNVELAVADTSKSALLRAKEMGVKEVYADYLELLQKANVDAVVITLPNFLHVESSCLAAEKGVDIFVEKPLGRTAGECRTIVEAARKNNAKLMVGFYQRFLDCNRNLKSMIESGALGDIELIAYESVGSGAFSHRFPPSPVPEWWFDVEKMGGGALLDTGCHMIDLMRWLLRDEVSAQYVYLGHKFQLPQEDTVILSLKFENVGAKAVLMIGWFAIDTTHRIAIYGTAGSTTLGELAPRVSTKQVITEGIRNVGKRLARKEIEPYSLSEVSKAYYRELNHFIDCVRENKEPLVTGEDGLKCAKSIDDAYLLWHRANLKSEGSA
jgi:predicted dehydrogenase